MQSNVIEFPLLCRSLRMRECVLEFYNHLLREHRTKEASLLLQQYAVPIDHECVASACLSHPGARENVACLDAYPGLEAPFSDEQE